MDMKNAAEMTALKRLFDEALKQGLLDGLKVDRQPEQMSEEVSQPIMEEMDDMEEPRDGSFEDDMPSKPKGITVSMTKIGALTKPKEEKKEDSKSYYVGKKKRR